MKVSVIIRVFNGEHTIARAIESALAQNVATEQYEVLVVDDGSTDNTAHVALRFTEHVRFVGVPHQGITKITETAIFEAQGDLIIFLDADDEMLPRVLRTLSGAFERKDVDCAYGAYVEEYQGRTKKREPATPFQALMGAIMWRKDRLAEAGGFDGNTIFPEYEMLLRTWDQWQILRVPQPIFIYHRSRGTLTGNDARVTASLELLRQAYPDRASEIAGIRSYELE